MAVRLSEINKPSSPLASRGSSLALEADSENGSESSGGESVHRADVAVRHAGRAVEESGDWVDGNLGNGEGHELPVPGRGLAGRRDGDGEVVEHDECEDEDEGGGGSEHLVGLWRCVVGWDGTGFCRVGAIGSKLVSTQNSKRPSPDRPSFPRDAHGPHPPALEEHAAPRWDFQRGRGKLEGGGGGE